MFLWPALRESRRAAHRSGFERWVSLGAVRRLHARSSASQSHHLRSMHGRAGLLLMLVSYMPLARNFPTRRRHAAEASDGARPGPPDACRGEGMRRLLQAEGLAPNKRSDDAHARADRHGRSRKRTTNIRTSSPRRANARRAQFKHKSSHGGSPRRVNAPDSPYDPAALDAVSSYEEELRVSREDLLRKIEASSRDIAGRCRTAVEQSQEQEHAALFDDEERERVVEAYAAKLKASREEMIRKIIDQQAVERTKCLEELKKDVQSRAPGGRAGVSQRVRGAAARRTRRTPKDEMHMRRRC